MISDEKNKVEEIGLPKSTLWNYVKEILATQNMKSEKNIFQLLDKITTKYVNHISSIGSQICTEKGKKTLNVEHVIEALKRMNFDSHIKMLTSELDLNALENEEKIKEEKYENAMEVKQLINKQKKKGNKRKRPPETNEDIEDLANEQKQMFEMARLEQMQNILRTQGQSQGGVPVPISKHIPGENKKMRLDQYEQEIFATKTGSEEVNFD